MEKLIPISITAAEVTNLAIIFDNETKLPDFQAQVSLLDQDGKPLTSMSVDSRAYWGNNGKCEKSIEFMELAARIKKEINVLVTRHLNRQQNILDVKVGQ